MFRICGYQLKNSLCSLRIYVSVFAGMVIQIVSLMPLLEFSKIINEPLCIWESVIYSNCDVYAPVASFLAVLLLVSDIPFSTQNETYTLLRVSKKKWVAGKVLYLLCICAIYYLIAYIAGALFLSENAYLGNIWSMPLYSLAKDNSSSLTMAYNVYFPYEYVLRNLSPLSAVLLTYALSVAYGTLMSILVFWLNLKISRSLSYAAVMVVHIVNYILTVLSVSPSRINFSLFSNSLLIYHNIGIGADERYNSIPQSFLIYAVITVFLLFLIIRAIKQYDFRITVGGRQ